VQVTLAQTLHRAVIRHTLSIVVSDLGCSEELVSQPLQLSAVLTLCYNFYPSMCC
jgi:hypothetical protein